MNDTRRLWEFAWVRDLLIMLVAVLLLYAFYAARAVTVPVLVGLGLAYVFNPLVTFLNRKLRVPRWAGTVILIAGAVLAVVGAASYIAPKLAQQIWQLGRRLPRYLEVVGERLGVEWADWVSQAGITARNAAPTPADTPELLSTLAQLPWASIYAVLLKSLGVGFGVVSATIGVIGYLVVAGIVTSACFFFFTWKFDRVLEWFDQFIPPARRPRTLHILRRMDQSVSAFIRGRLIQALTLGIVLSVGWAIAGVPYWLLLGLLCGMLNLIPYAAVIGLPAAIALTWVHRLSGGVPFDPLAIFLWPSVVYCGGQLLDGWVVEPLVQGKATNLDPLSVLIAVLVGGSLLGIVGLLLAIPAAACIKILAEEVVLPHIRQYLSTVPPPEKSLLATPGAPTIQEVPARDQG